MTITAHIIDADEGVTKHIVDSGEALSVSGDQRVVLPEVSSADAALAINDGDILTVSVGEQTLLLAGLLANIENETGSDLAFADGVTVESLGDLLARTTPPASEPEYADAADGMADLVREEADAGDLFYLSDLPSVPELITPPQGAAGEVLELGELVELGGDRDALFGLDGGHGDQISVVAQPNDLWANTEFGGPVPEAVSHPHGGDIIDLLLSIDDGIS